MVLIFLSGGAAFGTAAKGDGVDNGTVFLLGAASPSENVIELLPTVGQSGGDLVLKLHCLNAASCGDAGFNLEPSSDLEISDA